MCTNPQIQNGYEVSCRECDQCAATYKNTWVARCVAEKQTLPFAYAITLTYADQLVQIDGEWHSVPPLGARVYRYKDVSNMWKRIRRAGQRKWGENIQLRYVIVGEKGTKFGRCHYHGVVFSDYPIIELGKIQGKKTNEFAYKRRLDWTLWGHGFVEFQQADRKGMSYALKYILKSRMTAERSRGYAREGKTEWLASSYLWCSKTPSVGAMWLWDKIRDLEEKGMCPPSLRIRVPGGGDWYVRDELQKQVCLYLHQANKEYRAKRGRDLAGWSTLIESVSGEIELEDTGEIVKRKPWEWLINGEQIEIDEEWTQQRIAEEGQKSYERFREDFIRKQRIKTRINDARSVLRNCGHIVPCDICANWLEQHERADIEQEYLLRFEHWKDRNRQWHKERDAEYEERFKEWWLTRLRPSRGCAIRESERLQEQFGTLVPIIKAQPNLFARKAVGGALQKPARQSKGTKG